LTACAAAADSGFAKMLFRICRKGSPAKWTVLVEGQHYGKYLDKENAVNDAVEAANDACQSGNIAEAWVGAVRVY